MDEEICYLETKVGCIKTFKLFTKCLPSIIITLNHMNPGLGIII